MDQAEGLRNMVNGAQVDFKALRSAPSTSLPPSDSPQVISISSGKGGVGKTNIVANLALALTRRGKRVLILDADLGLANIDILLGLSPRYTIEHLLTGQKRLEDVLVQGPEGMVILPAGSGIPDLADLNEGQKLFLLNEMDQLSQRIDLLLIDTGAGISANVLYFNLAAQESIIIITPEPTSLTDAYALIKVLATRHQKKHFIVLANAVTSEPEAKEVFKKISLVADRFLSSVSLDYLGFIPQDEHVLQAVRKQKAVLDLFPHSPAGKSFMALSQRLLDRPFRNRNEGNIQFFWKQVWEQAHFNVS